MQQSVYQFGWPHCSLEFNIQLWLLTQLLANADPERSSDSPCNWGPVIHQRMPQPQLSHLHRCEYVCRVCVKMCVVQETRQPEMGIPHWQSQAERLLMRPAYSDSQCPTWRRTHRYWRSYWRAGWDRGWGSRRSGDTYWLLVRRKRKKDIYVIDSKDHLIKQFLFCALHLRFDWLYF